jgi:hypothetical protein
MALIGTLGMLIGLMHQPWAWMLVLQRIGASGWLPALSLGCLLAGSGAVGIWRRRFCIRRPRLADLRDRFAGGFLMGAGSALVPGSNDSLVLQQLPAGHSEAFLAYAAMLIAIVATLLILRRAAAD